MTRIRIAGVLAVGAVCGATIFGTAAAQAHRRGGTTTVPVLRLTGVTVVDAKTVEATFSNALAASNIDLSLRVFHAPHFDHDTPRSHEAAAVVLANGSRTARVTLARGLHPEESVCDSDSGPRCSDDELPFVVTKARDIFGQTVSDHDWDLWAVGSEN